MGAAPSVDEHRKAGNELFGTGNYKNALQHYSTALLLAPTDVKLLSNRSAALCKLGRFAEGLFDAQAGIGCDPTWSKSYFRAAMAANGLSQHIRALGFVRTSSVPFLWFAADP